MWLIWDVLVISLILPPHQCLSSGFEIRCNEEKCVESCKEFWVKNGDHCFYWSMNSANWTEAENYCRSGGGHLASVTSNATNEFILSELSKRDNSRLWIGGTDKGEQGVWNWTDCSPWEFTYWQENQPSNHKRQDCIRYSRKATSTSKPKWNDWLCDHKYKFVCTQKLCPGDIYVDDLRSANLSRVNHSVSSYSSNRYWYQCNLLTITS